MDIQKLIDDAIDGKTILIPEMTSAEKKKMHAALFTVIRAISILSPSDKPTNYTRHLSAKKRPWWKRMFKK